MTTERSAEYLAGLVRELCKLPDEIEYVEFKHNNSNPELIGEYLSALFNAAALNGKANGYLVWGVENKTHAVIGTEFSPSKTKKGNEPIETWLLHSLTPKIDFRFHEFEMDGRPMVLLEIGHAFRHPVRFKDKAFIRVGPVTKPLKDAPDRERELWRIFDKKPFEDMVAAERVSADEVLRLLDYPAYFELLGQPLPANRDAILAALADEGLIRRAEAGGWDIMNFGAVLFAKKLADFRGLKRKAVRVIQYKGNGRTETLRSMKAQKATPTASRAWSATSTGCCPRTRSSARPCARRCRCFPSRPCASWWPTR